MPCIFLRQFMRMCLDVKEKLNDARCVSLEMGFFPTNYSN